MAYDPLPLAQDLIRRASVTPADAGAMDVLQAALERLDFTCRRMRFGTACVECGLPLEIGEFVPRDVLDEALDLIAAEVEDDPRYQENDPIVELLRRFRPLGTPEGSE